MKRAKLNKLRITPGSTRPGISLAWFCIKVVVLAGQPETLYSTKYAKGWIYVWQEINREPIR